MPRLVPAALAIALILVLAPPALSAPAHKHTHKRVLHKKRHVSRHWHGYGFLPGYHPPPNTNVPIYGPRGAIGDGPEYVPSYWDYRGHYYFGRPGYYRGRYNGGSFGPCWTPTPIGPMWNCG